MIASCLLLLMAHYLKPVQAVRIGREWPQYLAYFIPPLRESDTIAWVVSHSISVVSLESRPWCKPGSSCICVMCGGAKEGVDSSVFQITSWSSDWNIPCPHAKVFSHSMLCIDDDGNGNHGKLIIRTCVCFSFLFWSLYIGYVDRSLYQFFFFSWSNFQEHSYVVF